MIIEQVADHAGKDKQSHLLKHAALRNHGRVDLSNIEIIDSSFHDNKLKRKNFWGTLHQAILTITEFPRALSKTESF